MSTAQVVETSVTVNNNSPIQDYVHPDDQTQPTFMRIFMGKKPIVSVTYENERISIKKQVTLLKMCVSSGPVCSMGRFMAVLWVVL